MRKPRKGVTKSSCMSTGSPHEAMPCQCSPTLQHSEPAVICLRPQPAGGPTGPGIAEAGAARRCTWGVWTKWTGWTDSTDSRPNGRPWPAPICDCTCRSPRTTAMQKEDMDFLRYGHCNAASCPRPFTLLTAHLCKSSKRLLACAKREVQYAACYGAVAMTVGARASVGRGPLSPSVVHDEVGR